MKKSVKHITKKKHTLRTKKRFSFFDLALHHQIIIVLSLSIAFFLGISYFVNQKANHSLAYQITFKCDYKNPYSSMPRNGFSYWVPGLNRTIHSYCNWNYYCNSNHNGTTNLWNLCQPIGQPGYISQCKCNYGQSGRYGGSFTCNNGNVQRWCGGDLVCDTNTKQYGVWPCTIPTPVLRPCQQHGGKCTINPYMCSVYPSACGKTCGVVFGSGWKMAGDSGSYQCDASGQLICCVR